MHIVPGMNQDAVPIGPEMPRDGPSPLASYDGYAVIEVPSFEVFAQALKDDYYINVIRPDEDKFVDKKYGVLRSRGLAKHVHIL